ncbi:protein of unknown function [Cardinium endosymbiont cEper1 of Encarsia pergandiella]|nr:protein of unknown function [Cardinium endosymbiont cEper1 of Encarsia pergandiella]
MMLPDTHGHESMKLGAKAIHKHPCAMCGKAYTHKHTKKVSGSCNYRHLCKMCVGFTPLPTCTEM